MSDERSDIEKLSALVDATKAQAMESGESVFFTSQRYYRDPLRQAYRFMQHYSHGPGPFDALRPLTVEEAQHIVDKYSARFDQSGPGPFGTMDALLEQLIVDERGAKIEEGQRLLDDTVFDMNNRPESHPPAHGERLHYPNAINIGEITHKKEQ